MNGKALLRRNVRATLAQFASILAALSLGAVVLLAVSGALGGAISRSASSLDNSSSLSVLQLDSVAPRGPTKPLTARAIASMRRIPGVQDVRPSAQFGISIVDESASTLAGAFWATPRVPWVQPRLTTTAPGVAPDHVLAGDEVYLPDTHLGSNTRTLLGKQVTIQYTKATGPSQGEAAMAVVRVIGLFDNSTPGADGESAMYVSDALSRTLLCAQLGLPSNGSVPDGYAYPTVYVKVWSTRDVAGVQTALVRMGYSAQSLAARAQQLPAVLELAARMNDILGALLAIFCIGIGLSLGGTWSSLRRWDVGVLAALGWSRARILGSYTAEVAIVGLVVGLGASGLGCLASMLLGLGLAGRDVFGAEFAGGPAVPATSWLAAVIVGMPLALVVGSAPRVLRLAGLPPDVALRRRD